MSFAATVAEPREFLLLFDLDGVLVIKNLHHQKLPNPVNTEVYRRECLSGLSFYVRPNLNQFFQDLRETLVSLYADPSAAAAQTSSRTCRRRLSPSAVSGASP